jgi:segregation and condensation protein B
MNKDEVKYFIEAALLASDKPLKIDTIESLFDDDLKPTRSVIRESLKNLQLEYQARDIELIEVASGFRIQVTPRISKKLDKLWEWRAPRYSRALFETLALIAYRQPITRGEIEQVRGVSVSSNIIKSLIERDWIYITGQRDVPGRPEMFGTTKVFLDYFGLKKLDDLPPLADLSDWEAIKIKLDLPEIEPQAIKEERLVNPILEDNNIEEESIDESLTEVALNSAKLISDVNIEKIIDGVDSENDNNNDPNDSDG